VIDPAVPRSALINTVRIQRPRTSLDALQDKPRSVRVTRRLRRGRHMRPSSAEPHLIGATHRPAARSPGTDPGVSLRRRAQGQRGITPRRIMSGAALARSHHPDIPGGQSPHTYTSSRPRTFHTHPRSFRHSDDVPETALLAKSAPTVQNRRGRALAHLDEATVPGTEALENTTPASPFQLKDAAVGPSYPQRRARSCRGCPTGSPSCRGRE